MDGKFSTPINPKDGHTVVDCIDLRERRVLEFIIPILYSEKPTQITVTVANMIFGTLTGVRKISWGLVMQEVVGKLVSKLEKEKNSSISPYLFYLYHRFECLRGEEMEMLEIARYMLEYGVSPEAETQPDTVGLDSDRESLSSAEQQKLQTVTPGSQKKQTYQALDEKTPVRQPDWRAIAMTSFDFKDNPFQRIREEMDQLQG